MKSLIFSLQGKLGILALAPVSALVLVAQAHATLKISSGPTQNVTCSGGVCSATYADAVLNAGDLANMLAGGDVTVQSGSSAKLIEVDAKLVWTSESLLTLDAGNYSITFKKPLIVAGPGSLSIATRDEGRGGEIEFSKKGHIEFKNPAASSLTINNHLYALAISIPDIKNLVKAGKAYVALASNNKPRAIYGKTPLPNSPNIFEGLGNTISNLTLNGGDGLFEANGGTMRDLNLSNMQIQAGSAECAGGLVNFNGGQIVGVSVTGNISAARAVGGLVCENQFGTISRSQANVTITGGSTDVGGLVALNETECSSGCAGSISDSYSSGTITGGTGTTIGGLVGYNFGGTIANSYSTSSISADGSASMGGLVGLNADNPGEQSHPKITSSYAAGAVSGTGASIGGLIGEDSAATGGIANTYWDLDSSGISDPSQGAGNVENDPGITGLSDAQLKSGLPSGLPGNVWKHSTKRNNGYPYLIDNPPPK